MTFGSIYIGGGLMVLALCAIAIVLYSFGRAVSAYGAYVITGIIDEFDVLTGQLDSPNHPLGIIFDAVLLFIFSIILSAIWPFVGLGGIGCVVAWCNRRIYLKLKEREHIMAKLKGEHLKDSQQGSI